MVEAHAASRCPEVHGASGNRTLGQLCRIAYPLEVQIPLPLSHALVSVEHSGRDPAHRLRGHKTAKLRPGIDQGHAVVDGRSCLHCWRPGSANEKTNPLGQFAAGSKAFRSPQNVISI